MQTTAMFDLGGRTALVTGSVRGLGYEMARGLAAAGARVILNGRDPASLDTAVRRLRGEGLPVTGTAFDVTDLQAADTAIRGLAPIDVLVNNVGHRDRRGADQLTPVDLHHRQLRRARHLRHRDQRAARRRP